MLKDKYDFVIVGSGLYGLTFNYLARQHGYTCIIIEKRPHVGGNIYTPIVDGIPIHQYGPHIFHTNNKEVWEFVSSLCEMKPFVNEPLAVYENEVYNLPFNMNTFSKLFNVINPSDAKEIIEKEKSEIGNKTPENLEEQAISLVGKTVYEKLVKGYTEKQWGKKCKDLPPEIIKRLPVRFVYNNNYFDDYFQGIPKGGYNTLIKKLLCDTEVIHDNYFFNRKYYNSLGNCVVYTGPIDEYFDFTEGCLEWRSVEFKTQEYPIQNFQGNAVINYTSKDVPYTRVIEHKFFDKEGESFLNEKTYVSKEYSIEWSKEKEPYYPINNIKNNEIFNKYWEKALNEKNVIFGGRLGCYKYYDMDDTIISATKDFNYFLENNNLNIWVMSHKDGKPLFEYEKYFKHIHIGSFFNENTSCFIKDNIGDNISFKNKVYCELTGLYWVWKNYNNSKYVGFEHYRRHFNINKSNIIEKLNEYDIIVPQKEYLNGNTLVEHYGRHHNESDIKAVELIVKDLYPEYAESWDKYMNNNTWLYPFNMFITKNKTFNEIMCFLFSIFEELEKRYNIYTIDDWSDYIKKTRKINTFEYQLRIMGFLSERLITLWVLHNITENKICEVNVEVNKKQR